MSWTTCTRSMLRKSGITLNERLGNRELFAERTDLLAVRRKFRIVALIFQRVHHEFGDARGLFLLEAACRNGGSTEADARRGHRLSPFIRGGIFFVWGNAAVEGRL